MSKSAENHTMSGEVFLRLAEASLPRIFGLCDREAASPTYGCCERNYWHYKLHDFPNIRFQEIAAILAMIARFPLFKPFYHNENVRALAIAAIDFAFTQQNADGSFNEVYPFERSFCGTSFAGCALAESLLSLNISGWESQLMKLGNWLSSHENLDVANQMAAAANALYLLFLLTQDAQYRDASERKIAQILEQKGERHFLPEYGGCDLGYLTISLSHLAALWEYSSQQEVYALALELAEFIEAQLDQYGRFDWTNMSRKTQFVYPYGFAALKRFSALEKLEQGLNRNMILNPTWMDDRYCIAFTLDYLKTALALHEHAGQQSASQS